MRAALVTLTMCLLALPANAKYSGGTGEPNDPYQIATAAELIALGETPDDYDKHFILTTDIDLDPNLPDGRVFDKAVIAPETNDTTWRFEGTPFTGVFDGDGHVISHLTIVGGSYLGLFGQLGSWGQLGSAASVSNLGLEAAKITGAVSYVGGLVGCNWYGSIANCYSTGSVSGTYNDVGGLVGYNDGSITASYSSGSVNGTSRSVGGLVGSNSRKIAGCCSSGLVSGDQYVGGLVGYNSGSITTSYSSALVSGSEGIGGLVGSGSPDYVSNSVWDMETSGQSRSAGGVGLTTVEMKDPEMLGLNGFAGDPNWVMDAGRDYPRLAWEGTRGNIIAEPEIDWLEGQGTAEAPYRIHTADQVIFLGRVASGLWNRHFVLGADIDLDPALPGRLVFEQPVIPVFSGVFDGGGYVISNLNVDGGSYLGLFGRLTSTANVRNVRVVNGNITGSGSYVAGLAGFNRGSITTSYSTGSVNGNSSVGGLVGINADGGSIAMSYSSGSVIGNEHVGGLVGENDGGDVTQCYSMAAVIGSEDVGGLVGVNNVYESLFRDWAGNIAQSYSAGSVTGDYYVGGLVGSGRDNVTQCFWDAETSGQTTSDGGTGRTTAEMQKGSTFLIWATCGHEGIWTIDEGKDYPRLWWEEHAGEPIRSPSLFDLLPGAGTEEDPFLIYTADQLETVGLFPCEWDKHFKLMSDIDLDPDLPGRKVFDKAVIAHDFSDNCGFFYGIPFTGVFDGNGYTISHLTITGGGYLGLFGQLASTAEVCNLGLEAVKITGTGVCVGGLAGTNGYWSRLGVTTGGSVVNCYSTGAIMGDDDVGGLVGANGGSIATSYSTGAVSGIYRIGGLVGDNRGNIAMSQSTGSVSGIGDYVGGLAGYNSPGSIVASYAAGEVNGSWYVGGLVGYNQGGALNQCYSSALVHGRNVAGGLVGIGKLDGVTACFWDKQTSGQTTGAGGTGKTTAEMQTAQTFLDAGWDFVGETANGTEDIWWILEGKDYPRLWWELEEEATNP